MQDGVDRALSTGPSTFATATGYGLVAVAAVTVSPAQSRPSVVKENTTVASFSVSGDIRPFLLATLVPL